MASLKCPGPNPNRVFHTRGKGESEGVIILGSAEKPSEGGLREELKYKNFFCKLGTVIRLRRGRN